MSLTIRAAQVIAESDSSLVAVPDGWPRVELGEVATIINGFAFHSRQFVPEGGMPLIRIRDLYKDTTAVGYTGDYEPRFVVAPGELLVGMDGDFNCARWQGPTALLNQRVCKIVPDSNKLDLDYLTHILPGYLNAIHDVTSSTTVTHLSSRDVAQIPIPVPSLEEQRKLARLCDWGTTKTTSCRSHLVTSQRALDRLRLAVLAAGCSGRLTAEWRESSPLAAAIGIVDSTSASRHSRMGRKHKAVLSPESGDELPDGWAWTTVGALVDVATGSTPLRSKKDYYGGDIPWVTSGAVNAGRITEAAEWITELAVKETNAKLFPVGTLLVAMYGEGQTRGRVAELGIAAATNQAVAALLFNDDNEYLRPYLRLFFLENYEKIRRLAFGGVQPNLSLGVIKTMPIALPPRLEQEEIVLRVERMLATGQELKLRVARSRRSVERVPQAILGRALRSGLVPDEDVVMAHSPEV